MAEQAVSMHVLQTFTSQNIANTAWAYARVGILNAELMDALAERALVPEVLASFQAQDLANTVWAYTVLGLESPALMEALTIKSQSETLWNSMT